MKILRQKKTNEGRRDHLDVSLAFGDCVAGVQLFKRCRNLFAGTVLQGCTCLSGVET